MSTTSASEPAAAGFADKPAGTTAKKTSVKTSYTVLTQDDSQLWKVAATINAASADAAIRAHLAKGEGTELARAFVAIPARSWKPIKATIETKSVVKLADAN